MTKMVAGKSYFGDNATVGLNERSRFIGLVHEFFRLASSNMEDFFPLLKCVTRTERRMENISKEMDKLFQEMVDEQRRKMESRRGGAIAGKESEERKTIVEVMLELQQTEPEYYTDEIIRGMILVRI
jgi:cytochrome P450